MTEVGLPSTIEPGDWFVVFHHRSLNRWLAAVTPGPFKHVSVFGYLPGVKMWLCYDVQWSGTRIALLDKTAIMEWTAGCAVVQIATTGQSMHASSRFGLYCVNAVKHLLRLKCVAATPTGLYRHILCHGGRLISEPRPTPAAAGGPAAGPGAGAGQAGHDQVAAGANPV